MYGAVRLHISRVPAAKPILAELGRPGEMDWRRACAAATIAMKALWTTAF